MKSLERDPQKRHATAAAFADELEKAVRAIALDRQRSRSRRVRAKGARAGHRAAARSRARVARAERAESHRSRRSRRRRRPCSAAARPRASRRLRSRFRPRVAGRQPPTIFSPRSRAQGASARGIVVDDDARSSAALLGGGLFWTSRSQRRRRSAPAGNAALAPHGRAARRSSPNAPRPRPTAPRSTRAAPVASVAPRRRQPARPPSRSPVQQLPAVVQSGAAPVQRRAEARRRAAAPKRLRRPKTFLAIHTASQDDSQAVGRERLAWPCASASAGDSASRASCSGNRAADPASRFFAVHNVMRAIGLNQTGRGEPRDARHGARGEAAALASGDVRRGGRDGRSGCGRSRASARRSRGARWSPRRTAARRRSRRARVRRSPGPIRCGAHAWRAARASIWCRAGPGGTRRRRRRRARSRRAERARRPPFWCPGRSYAGNTEGGERRAGGELRGELGRARTRVPSRSRRRGSASRST